MRLIQTSVEVALAAVKPLEGLLSYRAYCLAQARRAIHEAPRRRDRSPVGGAILERFGEVDGLVYGRCPESGGVFLMDVADPLRWAELLAEVSRYRHSPRAFHARLAQSRADHVYAPKVEWVRETLRLHGFERPRVLEVTTAPSDFTALLKASGVCSEVATIDEMALAAGRATAGPRQAHAAVLLESLDRVDDPAALVRAVGRCVEPGGLVFITALVSSGFDLSVLGARTLYLYPPDRVNCFSLQGLQRVCRQEGFSLVEVSTPGMLDVEIVRRHLAHDPSLPLSAFERQLLDADQETHEAFQAFLQQQGFSSFARLVARTS
jgi:hypothetical protein